MENNKEEIVEKTKKSRTKKNTAILTEKEQVAKQATKKKSTTTEKTTKNVASAKKKSTKKAKSGNGEQKKSTKKSTKAKTEDNVVAEPTITDDKPNEELENQQQADATEETLKTESSVSTEQVEEKSDKIKPEKRKLSKASQKKLALFGIILSALCLLGILAGVIVWWVSVNVPMQTPTISITSLENKTYIFAEYNPKAVGYEFSFKEKDEEKENIIFSDSNMIEVAKYLSKPSIFELKVRSIGEIVGANSEWSEILTYTYNMRLQTPEISEIKSGEDTVITWKPIQYAQNYKIYYKRNDGDWKNILVGQSASNQNVVVNFTNLTGIEAGNYQVYMVAYPSAGNQFVSESFTSNILYVVKYSTLENCTIEQNSKFVYTIKYNKNLINYVKNFEILINNCKFIVNKDMVLKNGINQGENICYTFDITGSYNEVTNGVPSICKVKAISASSYMHDSAEIEFTLD